VRADLLHVTSAFVLVSASQLLRLYSHLFTASQPYTALEPLPVTLWLHSGMRIAPN